MKKLREKEKITNMKLYEKILIGIIFLTELISIFGGMEVWFRLAVWLLAISYLVGGYWLFNAKDKEHESKFISITAGLVFASALFTLPFTIRLNRDSVLFEILPVFNIVFFIALGIYFIYKRKSENKNPIFKNIFIRSLFVLIVTCFFSYTPVSFKPYRYVLIALNYGNKHLVGNMQMFNYTEKFGKAMKNGDCDCTIEFAEKANEAGKIWLGVLSEEKMDNSPQAQEVLDVLQSGSDKQITELLEILHNQNQLWKIGGTFDNLYTAYTCKADDYYNKGKFEQALTYYLKADKALNAYNNDWTIEKSYSLNQVALCYTKLYNYEYADSLFVKAIEKYQEIKGLTGRYLAIFCRNFAESQAEQQQFGYSNLLHKVSIAILQKDSINNNEKKIIENYNCLIKNHLQTDSLDKAMFCIEETFKLIDKETTDFCTTNLYYGFYLYRLNQYKRADEVFTECLDCYKKHFEAAHQNIAEAHLALARIKIVLAEYEKAKDNLNRGIKITTENFGKNSVRYANYLKTYAFLDKLLANYNEAGKAYNQVLEIYTKELGERNQKLPEVLSEIADLEISLSNYGKAKKYSDSSMSIAGDFDFPNILTMSELTNCAGYVNYCVGLYGIADSLYCKSIAANKNTELNPNNAQTATALNGLGLVMTAKQKYKIADSLFTQSLNLHKEIFTENHPFTAVVYLNFANLKLSQNKLKEAAEMLNKSLEINKKFFDGTHDIFGDIYVAFGDLANNEKQPNLAKDYYKKALNIYLEKFGEEHNKVVMTKKKIKN